MLSLKCRSMFVPYTASALKTLHRPDHVCNSDKSVHTLELFDVKGKYNSLLISYCFSPKNTFNMYSIFGL